MPDSQISAASSGGTSASACRMPPTICWIGRLERLGDVVRLEDDLGREAALQIASLHMDGHALAVSLGDGASPTPS